MARKRLRTQTRMLMLGLASGAPALLIAVYFIWRRTAWLSETRWVLTLALLAGWWGFALAARHRALFTLGTFANLLAALREGDYSVRARGGGGEDAFAELALEINLLSQELRRGRVGGLEAGALLDKVVAAIDICVFAFDDQWRLRLVNPAGARLLAAAPAQLLGQGARQLQLDELLAGPPASVAEATFPGGPGRWDIRHAAFRQEGRRHTLLLVSDLSQALRLEERQAFFRLIRVLGHEINNSLAPVMSLAESLAGLLAARPPEWAADVERGLEVIAARAASLNRFMTAYTRLARLPPPRLRPVEVRRALENAVRLEPRLAVQVQAGPALTLQADPDQLQQALINLVRNAVDAALSIGGGVRAGWEVGPAWLEIWIADEGPGLAATTNLFVPFFTTKPGGSGIGLVLSRQIAEAHGGRLTLVNRCDGRDGETGCEARLYLPLAAPAPSSSTV